MDFLVIVNESPWGGTLGRTAARFVRAAIASGNRVPVVFFRNDGVYHGQPGRLSDGGLPSHLDEWTEFHRLHHTRLLLCSAASARRLPGALAANLPEGFSETGLADMWARAVECDRVVSF
jgi:sulfur relay protein TusD/DsrE